ncbi:hypothetical protein RhiirA4_518041 [Rhizophagus irregularis]|uniref:Uncharacterized protein n=1 Tax=Rhizophagus irregularis TaxID=588596 RepID=A0A2I1GGU9_9GLOM|nr:hypothetical protein RhiirA4_518041 [Rhizophagus irregularis]
MMVIPDDTPKFYDRVNTTVLDDELEDRPTSELGSRHAEILRHITPIRHYNTTLNMNLRTKIWCTFTPPNCRIIWNNYTSIYATGPTASEKLGTFGFVWTAISKPSTSIQYKELDIFCELSRRFKAIYESSSDHSCVLLSKSTLVLHPKC